MRKILIIGAGPGGLCAGKRLRDAGYRDFLILEQAPNVGGTWRHNTYPGCRCDVPVHLYSFSFAPKLDWTEPYASQPEILSYLESCADRFGLRPHLRFNTRVESASWEETPGRWTVRTSAGETLTADILVSAIGLFNEPAYPDIIGLDTFAGTVMHSARWDPRQNFAGKAVSVIGSAASAVQLVPEVAKNCGHLTVYQRTPNYISPRETEFSAEFRAACEADPEAAAAAERERTIGWLNAVITLDDPKVMGEMSRLCLENLDQVKDPELRRKMTPDYPFGSKRGLISSDWYPTFNRPNVELVTESIEAVTSNAIVTVDGAARQTDAVILATGFETTRFLSAIPVRGRDGVDLSAAWAQGAQAYLGITTAAFPNLFMLYGPNTNNGAIIHQLECQVEYLLGKLAMMDRTGLQWIDVRPEAVRDYNRELQEAIAGVDVWQADVSGYYRAESGLNVTQWPHSMDRYQRETQRLDDDAYETMPFVD